MPAFEVGRRASSSMAKAACAGCWKIAVYCCRIMRRNAKILVAEDDPNDQLLLEKAFQAAGLNNGIRYVPDGAQAVEYLKNLGPTELPALLLVDLKMPRMNGFELMDWVGRQRRLDAMRVV